MRNEYRPCQHLEKSPCFHKRSRTNTVRIDANSETRRRVKEDSCDVSTDPIDRTGVLRKGTRRKGNNAEDRKNACQGHGHRGQGLLTATAVGLTTAAVDTEDTGREEGEGTTRSKRREILYTNPRGITYLHSHASSVQIRGPACQVLTKPCLREADV